MVTTPPVPPGHPEDRDDPTGIRALLAGLGDPGPMPAHLVDRINASIAAEQQARGPHPSGTVVPLRRRLPAWSRVGLVAAAVAAVAVGIPTMLGTGPGDMMASLTRGGASSASDAAAGAPAPQLQSGQGPSAGSNRMASGVGAVTLAASGTAYTSSALATQARTVLDRGPAPLELDDSLKGAAATNQTGLRDCLTALGVATWMPVAGDVGTYDGRPAVVAVVSTDTRQDVYAVGPDCDAAHPTVMAGPVPLG